MAEYKCKIEGCTSVLKTDEPVSAGFFYICSGRQSYGDDRLAHTREQQVVAAGRKYNPETDEADKDVHFQDSQFDKDLRKSSKPTGTSHIANQGSDVLTSKDVAFLRGEQNGK